MGTEFFRRFIKTSVFLKLLIAFFLVILPLYILILRVNMLAINNSRKKIVESTQSKFSFLIGTIEKEISNVMTRQKELMNDKDLHLISNVKIIPNSYESSVSILEIKKRLDFITETNVYVKAITIYVPLIEKCISSSAIYQMSAAEMDFFNRATDMQPYVYPFRQEHDKIYMNLTSATYYEGDDSKKVPSYLITVEISEELLNSTLRDFIGYEQGKVALVGGIGGINFSGDIDPEILEAIKSYLSGLGNDFERVQDKSFALDFTNQTFIIYQKSQILSTTFIAYFPKDQLFGEISNYFVWIWIISLYTLFLVILFVAGINIMVSRPLGRLVYGFKEAVRGNFNIELQYKNSDEFEYIYKKFNIMIAQIKELIEQVYEEKIRCNSAELKQLQYQINPHFLYNAIYFIYRMSKVKDFKTIETICENLGSFYRYITKGAGQEVCFKDEVNHAQNYLNVLCMRFGKKICVEFDDIPERYLSIPVPKLILQPLIENAFEHGIGKKTEAGMLRIKMDLEKGMLAVTVEDNGSQLSDEKIDEINRLLCNTDANIEITGLLNVHRRIRIKFGEHYGLTASRSELGGLKVKMRIRI